MKQHFQLCYLITILRILQRQQIQVFCQFLPDKSCQLKTEKCSGGKHSKIRITSLAAANAVGNKLPVFAIRKAKNPRCFKNIKKLLRRYRSQRKRMGEQKQKQKILSRRKTSSIDHWQFPGPSNYWESVTRKISFFCHQILHQWVSRWIKA